MPLRGSSARSGRRARHASRGVPKRRCPRGSKIRGKARHGALEGADHALVSQLACSQLQPVSPPPARQRTNSALLCKASWRGIKSRHLARVCAVPTKQTPASEKAKWRGASPRGRLGSLPSVASGRCWLFSAVGADPQYWAEDATVEREGAGDGFEESPGGVIGVRFCLCCPAAGLPPVGRNSASAGRRHRPRR